MMLVGGQHYGQSVTEALTVRGRLALGRTAQELQDIGYTAELATEDGWTVSLDDGNAWWVAYVGNLFSPDTFVFMIPERH